MTKCKCPPLFGGGFTFYGGNYRKRYDVRAYRYSKNLIETNLVVGYILKITCQTVNYASHKLLNQMLGIS